MKRVKLTQIVNRIVVKILSFQSQRIKKTFNKLNKLSKI